MMSQTIIFNRFIPTLIQKAGAHKKPRWIPVAKSKIYRIPKRPEVPEEERLELLRLNNNYKTQMRAIRRFYHDEMIREKSTTESASSEMSMRLEAEDWERCVKINEEWNKQVALERDERRKVEIQEMEEQVLAKIQRKDQEMRDRIAKASEAIRIEKELSKTFITPETLDAAIDNALANPVDYNFAIDLKGHIYQGRETLPIPPKEEKSASAL